MKYVGIGFAVIVVFIVVAFFFMGQQSQSGTALGLVNGNLAPCPASPNCASSLTDEPEKQVPSLQLKDWEKLPALITEMGGEITQSSDTYIASEFTSSIFKFVDDVEFHRATDVIHVRSASRVGHSDGGVNQARVQLIIEKIQ